MLWIRESFLAFVRWDHGAVIVHGHTPRSGSRRVLPNRIAIDTGAILGGALTCVVLEDDTAWLFTELMSGVLWRLRLSACDFRAMAGRWVVPT